MIDLAAAKAHLRLEAAVTTEDPIVQSYLDAAIASIQSATQKPFTARAVTQTFDGFPRCGQALRLWQAPVEAESPAPVVKYDDVNGVEQTLASFRLVETSVGSKLLPAYGESWPCTAIGAGSVRVTYTAGYDGASGVPAELDQAVLFLVGHYYANREAAVVTERSATIAELPLGVEALIAPYCIPGIA